MYRPPAQQPPSQATSSSLGLPPGAPPVSGYSPVANWAPPSGQQEFSDLWPFPPTTRWFLPALHKASHPWRPSDRTVEPPQTPDFSACVFPKETGKFQPPSRPHFQLCCLPGSRVVLPLSCTLGLPGNRPSASVVQRGRPGSAAGTMAGSPLGPAPAAAQ